MQVSPITHLFKKTIVCNESFKQTHEMRWQLAILQVLQGKNKKKFKKRTKIV